MVEIAQDTVFAPFTPTDEIMTEETFRTNSETDALTTRRENQAALALNAKGMSDDIVASYLEMAQNRDPVDSGVTFNNAMTELLQQQKLALREVGASMLELTSSVEGQQEVVESVIDTEKDLEDQSLTIQGRYEQYISINTNPNQMTKEQMEDMANRMAILDIVEEIVADISGWEVAADLATELIFAPKFILDNIQTFGEFNPLSAEKAFRQLVSGFRGMSPEEQRRVFPQIKKELLAALPRTRAVQILLALADPTIVEDVAFEFGPLAVAESLLVLAGFATLIARGRKQFKIISQLSAMGRKQDAARINTAALADETGSMKDATGIDKLSAENSSLPFKTDDYDPAADNSISGAAQQHILGFRESARKITRDVDQNQQALPEGLLNPAEMQKAVDRIDDQFQGLVGNLLDQPKITEAGSIEIPSTLKFNRTITTRGVKYDFKISDQAGNEEIGEFTGSFNLDDIGKWTAMRRSFFNIASPRRLSVNTDLEEDVKAALRLDFSGTAVQTRFKQLLVAAGKGVRKEDGVGRTTQLRQIDEVLLEGDAARKQWTVLELKAGVGGNQLNDAQIVAYYNYREIFDSMFWLRNQTARRDMDGRGFLSISRVGPTKVGDDFEEVAGEAAGIGFGRPDVDAIAARTTIRNNPNIRQLVKLDSGEVRQVRDIDFDKLYADNYRLVFLQDDMIVGSSRYSHILVRSDNISDLPNQVLAYRDGYVPKFNPKGNYFVQSFRNSHINGAPGTTRKVMRGFDNKRDADAWAAEQRQLIAAEVHPDGILERHLDGGLDGIRVIKDGDLEALRVGDSRLGATEGLIYGPRREEPLPFGLDGSTNERASAFESLQLYLENTKNFATRNEWRMGMAKRWENTVFDATGIRAKFGDMSDTFRKSHQELARWHDRIAEWAGWENKSETFWDKMTLSAYEWATKAPFLGKDSRVTQFLHTTRQVDPLGAIRSITFHTLLGAFNPIQLLVQAQGAAVAAAVLGNPLKIARISGRANLLTALQHLDSSPGGMADMIKSFGKNGIGKGDVDEWTAIKQFWDETGLHDSVLSSADYDAAIMGYGITRSTFKRVSEKGLLFFRAGELFNRRFSFLTALDEFGGIAAVAGNVAKKKEVLSRTSDLMLNLQRANRASWQKGFLSIPTQFMQISAKTMESLWGANKILGKGANRISDRVRVMLMQAALYGSAGVFFGKSFARQFLSAVGVEQSDLDAEEYEKYIIGVNGGLSDLFFQGIGADVTFAERGSLVNGWDQSLISLMFEPNILPTILAGPSGALPERLYFFLKNKLWPLMAELEMPDTYENDPDLDEVSLAETLKFLAVDAGSALLSPFSTWTSIQKAWIMNDMDLILSRRRDIVARGPFSAMTVALTSVGLKPLVEREVATLRKLNRNNDEYIKMRADWIMHINVLIMLEIRDGNPDDARLRKLRRYRKASELSIPTFQLRKRVLEQVQRRVLDGKSQHARELRKYMLNRSEDLATMTREGTFGEQLIQSN